MASLESATVTRYVTPLREGGSLPAVCEADDLGTWVVKFRGAGQGPKVLVAEVIVAELARCLGIRVPAMKVLHLDEAFGRQEPDPEIAELLLASVGPNLGVDLLPGSLGHEGGSGEVPTEDAVRILWLDAFTGNVDRTWRNPNLLRWHGQVWAIDHGAALWFHHAWSSPERFAASAFDTADHVLVDHVPSVAHEAEELVGLLTDDVLAAAVDVVPDVWLASDPAFEDVSVARAGYRRYLTTRLAARAAWTPGVAV